MEFLKSTRLTVDTWKRLRNRATEEQSSVAEELNKILTKEFGENSE